MWSSRTVFILATIGSAVGLGNVWKFPYITGEYGGGAFVVVYLLCIALIGVPIMMAEILLGRRGRASPIVTMKRLAREQGSSPAWSLVGYSGVIAGFLILSFYSVVAGWAIAYVFQAGSGGFNGLDAGAARILAGQLAGGTGEEHLLSFERFPQLALSKTYNTNQQTPDSAGTGWRRRRSIAQSV